MTNRFHPMTALGNLRRFALALTLFGFATNGARAAPIVQVTGQVLDSSRTRIAEAPVSALGLAKVAELEQTGGPLGSSFVRALGRDDGFITSGAQLSDPSGQTQRWESRASFQETYTNTALVPLAFEFDFHIFRMDLRIMDLEGLPHEAEIFAQVQLSNPNGSRTFLLRIHEVLRGGLLGHTIHHEGTFVPASTFTCGRFSGLNCADVLYEFEPFHGTIPLGVFGPGESFEVQYFVEANVRGLPVDANGVSAFLGDPFDANGQGVSGTVRPVVDTASGVPEPSSLVLMLVGLGAVAAGFRGRLA